MITEYVKIMDRFYVVQIYVKIRDGLYAVTKYMLKQRMDYMQKEIYVEPMGK